MINKTGDCFKVAFDSILTMQDKDALLVHGEVMGTGGAIKGIRYAHAWIEFHFHGVPMVIDRSNGNDVTVPRVLYYQAASIQDNVFKYNANQALEHALETGIYGPWHLKTESGL